MNPIEFDHTENDDDFRRSYSNVLTAALETPWEVLPATLAIVAEVLALRIEGTRLSEQEIQARIGGGKRPTVAYASGGLAVIPLYGVIMPRATLMSQLSGGASLEQFQATLKQAVADPDIGSILLDIDSPGGSTSLVSETAALIRSAREEKPIVAIANTLAASAAYHLASQGTEVIVSPSGLVGSIGVFTIHEDLSRFLEKLGVKPTLISAGRYKTEGHMYEPLTAEAKAATQAIVDDVYSLFVDDVAAGRGVEASAVENGFGEGRLVTAKNAVKEGMADRVATLDETISRMRRNGSSQTTGTRASAQVDDEPPQDEPEVQIEDEPAELVPGAERLLARASFRDTFRPES